MRSLLQAFRKKKNIPLFFYNTLSGERDEFTPLRGKAVKMYNCGPTVYDFQHIGNMRAAVFADLLRRALVWNGYTVRQVINITDVGHLFGDNEGDASIGLDRLEVGAERRGLSVRNVVEEVTDAYFRDLDLLNVDRTKIQFPRATEFIGEQIALVQTLEEKGYTYTIRDGVYFDTSKWKKYGALGNINLSGLQEGARVEKIEGRKHPTDFALWKLSKPEAHRQQEWKSPWGVGFPGWHIECTAMIFKLLGRQIDVHTGGIEHIAIHHNNEIAQAEAVTDRPYVQYWLHNDHLLVDGKKISKSLGNTIFVRNILDRGFSPLALRYLFLGAHYRSSLNFTWDSLDAAHTALMRLYRFFLDDLRDAKHGKPNQEYISSFTLALNDDLNTAKAVAVMWECVKDESLTPAAKRATLLRFDAVLAIGLGKLTALPDSALKIKDIQTDDLPEEIQKILVKREKARLEKDWMTSDQLRSDVRALGYDIDDGSEGQKVRKLMQ